ncbi:hypothetical protein [Bacteriovorax sp. Seq25_V]|uniref:hypothetical protein n=1 Tax=Bacteriovorax sp. Seq25_V TaxID=1201288 RepID=UPI000424223E|nr:hypothetical protein [Bacteriovorax sp. Seq25_V]
MRRTGNLEKWDNFTKQCSSQFSTSLKLISDTGLTLAQLVPSLLQLQKPDFNIVEISKKKARVYKENSTYLEDFRYLMGQERTKSEIINRDYKKYFKKNTYADLFISMMVNIQVGNFSGAEFYISKMLSIPARYMAIEIEKSIDPKEREELKTLLLKSFKWVWESGVDEKLKVMFIQSFESLEDKELSDQIDSFLGELFSTNVDFSLSDYKYSLSHPGYWFERLTDESQKENLLVAYFKLPISKEIEIVNFGLFKYYYPRDEKDRDRLTTKIVTSWNNVTLYERESILTSLENQVIKKALVQKSSQFKNPTFNIKKDEYDKLTNKDGYGIYGIIKLLELGYENSDNLGWLLF